MKATVILSLVSLWATGALGAVVPMDSEANLSPVPVEASLPPLAGDVDPDAIAGGFGASCWDFSMDHTYFYATCSSGGAGSPAVRTAVDLNSRITNRNGNLAWDC
ncbi:hypothetical protein GQ53DRAFT_818724 [Thozetella sp. PMI_491]|nr:hypothetical protein GQ53DRAFT_818724 [Thozetella sp. PMI_491]